MGERSKVFNRGALRRTIVEGRRIVPPMRRFLLGATSGVLTGALALGIAWGTTGLLPVEKPKSPKVSERRHSADKTSQSRRANKTQSREKRAQAAAALALEGGR